MKYLNNDKGFALITALMTTMLSLAFVLGILSVVTRGIQATGSRKVYRNAVEASYGAANVTMYEIIPQLAYVILEAANPTEAITDTMTTSLKSNFDHIKLQFVSNSACLNQKLLNDSSGTNWSLCPNAPRSVKTKDIKNGPDIKFKLPGTSGASYTVYSKIVDTIPGTTYMARLPEGPLEGGGVVDSGAGGGSWGKHFVYRIEVIGEKADNPSEQGNLSIQYEY